MKIQVIVLVAMVVYVSGAHVEIEEASDSIQVLDSFGEVQAASIGSRNVISGILNTGDRLLHRGYYSRLGAGNAVETQDVRYVAATAATRISYISALAVGGTQSATAQITAGGVNTNNVTIRLTSNRNLGFDFWIEIWGR